MEFLEKHGASLSAFLCAAACFPCTAFAASAYMDCTDSAIKDIVKADLDAVREIFTTSAGIPEKQVPAEKTTGGVSDPVCVVTEDDSVFVKQKEELSSSDSKDSKQESGIPAEPDILDESYEQSPEITMKEEAESDIQNILTAGSPESFETYMVMEDAESPEEGQAESLEWMDSGFLNEYVLETDSGLSEEETEDADLVVSATENEADLLEYDLEENDYTYSEVKWSADAESSDEDSTVIPEEAEVIEESLEEQAFAGEPGDLQTAPVLDEKDYSEENNAESGYEVISDSVTVQSDVSEEEVSGTLSRQELLNQKIANAALALVDVTNGWQCTEVVSQALCDAGIDAVPLWPDEYAPAFGSYTDQPSAGNLVYYEDGGLGMAHIAVYVGNDMAVHGNYRNDKNESVTTLASVYTNGSMPQFIQVAV